jgi:hypothetical protein
MNLFSKKLLPLFLTVFFYFPSNAVFAWGKTAHRVVGEVATHYLTPQVLQSVNELLDNQSLAFVSTYPDELKSDSHFDKYKPWHYVNIPLDKEYEDITTDSRGNIVQAIEKCIKILGDKEKTKEERAFHLKFLVHLIGDLHQPLHTGRVEDYGGHKITVYWFDKETNLHTLWDSDMIDYYQMSYVELARNLPSLSVTDIQEIRQSSVADWTRESHQAARKIYESAESDAKLGYEYHYTHFDFVRMQLLKAGVRLAHILNSTLSVTN